MKYMLMMNTMKAGSAGFPGWGPNDIKTSITYMIDLNKNLKASGELVSAEGLSFPDQAKQVTAADDGTPITDGIFPESKEFLAGFWIIDVPTPQRAYEIAAMASAAPGLGGKPMNMPIEVRPIPGGPPPEFLK